MVLSVTGEERRLDLVVCDVAELADDVLGLTLARPAGGPLPAWSPGAHVDLELPNGLVRQYSLCGEVDDLDRWRVAVLREPEGRGGSRCVHEQAAGGWELAVRGPRNHFALQPAGRYLFIAGGIGITPIVPMLAAASRAGAAWQLVYGGRRRASMAFADELAERYPDRVKLVPEDEVGLLPLDQLLAEPLSDALVYCCGPERLLMAVDARCARWPAGSLHVERFAAKQQEPAGVDVGFEVELARSGKVVAVPAGCTLLAALADAGMEVESACEEGICGTCETRVLSGVPDHRDSVLTDEEREAGNTMFPCVSRASSSRLVLDL